MSFQIPAPPPPSASPPTSGAPPGAPPGEALAHSAFAEALARTALAEGLNQTHGEGESPRLHARHGSHEPRREAIVAERLADASEVAPSALAPLASKPAPGAPSPPRSERPAAKTQVGAPASSTEQQSPSVAEVKQSGSTTQPRAIKPADAQPPASGQPHGEAQPAAPAATPDSPASSKAVDAASPESPTASVGTEGTVPTSSTSPLAAEQASTPPKPGSQQLHNGRPAGEQRPDSACAASAPAATERAPTTTEAGPASASTASAPAPAESVAGLAGPPAPRNATGPAATDATIVREGAVAADKASPTPAAEMAPGGESEQPPSQHQSMTHLVSHAGVEVSLSSAATISSTQPPASAPAGEASVTSTVPLLAAAPGANQPGGVALADMVESIHATVELAARQGMAQARIALEPEELGNVRIHLSQTSDGLLARVSADTPAAAQALAGARAELQQSLSSLGVSLLRLDINSSGQPETRDPGSRSTSSPRTRPATPDTETELDGLHPVVEHKEMSPTGLGDGALVDVLA